jgi:uncharacterized protein DUF4399
LAGGWRTGKKNSHAGANSSISSGEGKPMMTAVRAALVLLAAFVFAGLTSASAETPSPPGARVYFINLKDAQEVTSPFLVQFGLSGMGVAPAGVEKPNTGHHHLLIDSALSGDALKQPIPMDDTHRHFGNGQTEAMISLPPGKHTLQLVLGDWSHIPHVPPVMSNVITIMVH